MEDRVLLHLSEMLHFDVKKEDINLEQIKAVWNLLAIGKEIDIHELYFKFKYLKEIGNSTPYYSELITSVVLNNE